LYYGDLVAAFLGAPMPMNPRTVLKPPPGIFPPDIYLWVVQALYGLRESPKIFGEYFAEVMKACHMVRSHADPQLYFGAQDTPMHGVIVVAYVDDLVVTGPDEALAAFREALDKEVQVKWSNPAGEEPVSFLGRKIKRVNNTFWVWMDTEYWQRLCRVAGFSEQVRPRATTGPPTQRGEDRSPQLSPSRAASYRSAIGMLLWAVPVRCDLGNVTRELSRRVASPTERDWQYLKHVCRYIMSTTDVKMAVEVGRLGAMSTEKNVLNVSGYADGSWASGVGLRSVTGFFLFLEGATISFASRTQTSVALSSCEAELVSMSSLAVEMIGLTQTLEEMGYEVKAQMWSDSASAVTTTTCRRGPGKLRHVALRHFWLQELHASRKISFASVPGELNVADLLTKPLPRARLLKLCNAVGCLPEVSPAYEGEMEAVQATEVKEEIEDEEPCRGGSRIGL
jgi:hypothetical protein